VTHVLVLELYVHVDSHVLQSEWAEGDDPLAVT
jgi:hypothetical protein